MVEFWFDDFMGAIDHDIGNTDMISTQHGPGKGLPAQPEHAQSSICQVWFAQQKLSTPRTLAA